MMHKTKIKGVEFISDYYIHCMTNEVVLRKIFVSGNIQCLIEVLSESVLMDIVSDIHSYEFKGGTS